jgi:hypothetical protein
MTFDIPPADTVPSPDRVLSAQGVPTESTSGTRYTEMVQDAISRYRRLAAPRGICREISLGDFERVYEGEGNNAEDTPLDSIAQDADYLSLFAVTVGEPVTGEISTLFAAEDFARAVMLDAAASEGAELAADALEALVWQDAEKSGRLGSDHKLVRFSPGYCGWHTSGQKRLFEYLRPRQIGIELGDSYLMQPLKSISGVFVGGPRDIFIFEDNFPFCRDCDTRSCRERIAALYRR